MGELLTGVSEKDFPVQMVSPKGAIIGVGLTVTVKVNIAPAQGNAVVGVTEYMAVCGVRVGLTRVPVMRF